MGRPTDIPPFRHDRSSGSGRGLGTLLMMVGVIGIVLWIVSIVI